MPKTSLSMICPLPTVPSNVEDADAAALIQMVRDARAESLRRQANYLAIREDFSLARKLRDEARERTRDLEAALSVRIEHEELERSGLDPKLFDWKRVPQD